MYSIVGLISEEERMKNVDTYFGRQLNIHSCGKFEGDAQGDFKRAASWRDEMLIYLLKGEAYIDMKGETHAVTAGDVAILPCKTAYKVRYSENVRWLFMHYDRGVPLDVFGLPDEPSFYIGPSEELSFGFDRLRVNLQRRDYYNAIVSTAIGIEIFALIGRMYCRQSGDIRFHDPIEYVANVMLSSKLGIATVEEYAKLAGLSVSEFRKRFKEKYGISPKQYVLDLRLTYIKSLLADESVSLKEAAKIACFTDYSYFSRFVLKHLGKSPQKYRESILSEVYKSRKK